MRDEFRLVIFIHRASPFLSNHYTNTSNK